MVSHGAHVVMLFLSVAVLGWRWPASAVGLTVDLDVPTFGIAGRYTVAEVSERGVLFEAS